MIDTAQIPEEICLHNFERQYPITIHIRDAEEVKPVIQSEWTFVFFNRKDDKYVAQVDLQKIYIKSEAYELD